MSLLPFAQRSTSPPTRCTHGRKDRITRPFAVVRRQPVLCIVCLLMFEHSYQPIPCFVPTARQTRCISRPPPVFTEIFHCRFYASAGDSYFCFRFSAHLYEHDDRRLLNTSKPFQHVQDWRCDYSSSGQGKGRSWLGLHQRGLQILKAEARSCTVS